MALDRPKFGISLAECYDLEEITGWARQVEALGFDSLWVTENVHSQVEALEPLITLSVMAAHTKRVSIGPAVVLLSLRNPVGLAHAVATLDKISGGRAVLGVGAGGEAPEGFQAYGVAREERGRRCDEALEIMEALWSRDSVSYSGRFNSFSDYDLGAKPLQRPHPPIWLGGSAPSVLHRAARWGQGFFPAHKPPAECAGLYRQVDEYTSLYSRSSGEVVKSVYLFVNLASRADEALRATQRVLQARYTYPVKYLRPGVNTLQGRPEDCVGLLREFQKAGAVHFVLDPTCPKAEVSGLLERLAQEVLPHFNK